MNIDLKGKVVKVQMKGRIKAYVVVYIFWKIFVFKSKCIEFDCYVKCVIEEVF